MINPADIFQGKILVVDDQDPNVLLLEKMLLGGGYRAITCTTDPTRVCELHLLNHYDLILLDLQMPRMDGFEVMENLKQIESGGYLPVLVITAQSDHKVRALKAGAKDFVSKPFDLAEVLLRVYNMLEVRLLHQETLRLYHRVLAEQKTSEHRLLNALPQAIADSLNAAAVATAVSSAGAIAPSSAELTVLFADAAEFTQFAVGASAEVLAGVLKAVSARLDGSPDRAGILGEAYLAAVGLPDLEGDLSLAAAAKALDLAEALDRFNAHSPCQIRLRVGMRPRATVPEDLAEDGQLFEL